MRGRGTRIALGVCGTLLVLLVLAQLLLPGIAADRVRERVGGYGTVHSAHVSAWPAVQLLWGDAGSASVHAGELRMSSAQASELLWSARGIDSLDVSAQSVLVAPLRLDAFALRKRGAAVHMTGTLTSADLRAALPAGAQLQSVALGAEGGLEVTVAGELFGVSASVVVLVGVADGKLVAGPRGISLGGLTQVTLYADPHLRIESVAFTAPQGGAEAQEWAMTLDATQA